MAFLTGLSAQVARPAPAADCVRTLKDRRAERERQEIQRQIDARQQAGGAGGGVDIRRAPRPQNAGSQGRPGGAMSGKPPAVPGRGQGAGSRDTVKGSRQEERTLSIEEKYDEVRQLISMGKEKGYLLYDEVNELLPADITSSEELDDLFSTFGNAGIEVVDSEQKYREDKLLGERPDGGGEDVRAGPHARARSTRPTIPSACTCARWAPCRSSRARARSRSPSASSAASSPSSSRSRARRPSRAPSSTWASSCAPASAPSASW